MSLDNLLLGNQTLLHFNLYINSRWEVERGERIDGLGTWVQDIDDAFVNAHFELLTSVLVDKGGTVDGPLLLLSRQRNRADHLPTTPFSCFNDHSRRLIDDLVIIRADLDPHTMGPGSFHGKSCLGLSIGHVQWRGGSPALRFLVSREIRAGKPPRFNLLDDLGHHTSADGLTTFADGKAHLIFNSDWRDEFDNDLNRVTWLNHGNIS